MNFEDCKNPKELYDAIEGNPTYKLMSRDINFRPEDFRLYRGSAAFPILGISEPIDLEKLQDPKQIYKHAKLCVLRLQRENPALKTGNFSNEEDPLTGLQNIMRWCCEAASGEKTNRYEEIKKHAAAKVNEWFISNPKYFHDKAKLIAKRCAAWDKEASRLNPDQKGCATKEKKPQIIHPILFLTGRYDAKKQQTIVPVSELSSNDAILVYCAALILLHDLRCCYTPIAKEIWPDGLGKHSFDVLNKDRPDKSDKSEFIEAALKHVQADLKPAETSPASDDKTGKTKTIAKKLKKPISDKAAAVYELLKTMPEHRGLTGRKIIEELSKKNVFIDQSTLTKNIIPILKKDYGVKNQPRIGYYIEK